MVPEKLGQNKREKILKKKDKISFPIWVHSQRFIEGIGTQCLFCEQTKKKRHAVKKAKQNDFGGFSSGKDPCLAKIVNDFL